MPFPDRRAAGQEVARRLLGMRLADPIVLALPRGGVPVAYEVAAALGAPLEVLVARKIGAPGRPELGIGAIAEGSPIPVLGAPLARSGVDPAAFVRLAAEERVELDRRVERYRGGRPLPGLEGRDVVVVDDGLATGVTAEAALVALRARRPARLLLAVPVCAPDTARRLGGLADEVVCVLAPDAFAAVGAFYDDFTQTTDEEVVTLLDRASRFVP